MAAKRLFKRWPMRAHTRSMSRTHPAVWTAAGHLCPSRASHYDRSNCHSQPNP
jgi:hypothetical protein